jgi:hypothetical protein
MCCDDCHLLLKIIYTCVVNGPAQAVGNKGTYNPGKPGGGPAHVAVQCLHGTGLDWTGIQVCASNNPPSKLFCLVNIHFYYHCSLT